MPSPSSISSPGRIFPPSLPPARFPRAARTLFSLAALVLAALLGASLPASANPTIAVDVATGKVMSHDEAFRPWSPASLTKLMTAMVAFRAIERGEATPQTPVVMSAYAASQEPSKMYWKPGTTVTLEEAIQILMVKSGNDVAAAVAETIGGTELEFVEMMNEEAARLGMTDSVFRNPHGLPDPGLQQVTTARDMAILGAAIRREFPQYDPIFALEALDTGAGQPILGYNLMLGRFEGADGMKTGFICASGFNIVNSATRTIDGERRTVLSVVLGAPSQERRAETSARLMEDAFGPVPDDAPTLETLEPYGDRTTRTNLRSKICTQEAASKRYDGRDVEGRMVLDTDLITPRDRAPITARIDPGPALPFPRVKPASLGGPEVPPSMPRPDGSAVPVPQTKPSDMASMGDASGTEAEPPAAMRGTDTEAMSGAMPDAANDNDPAQGDDLAQGGEAADAEVTPAAAAQ